MTTNPQSPPRDEAHAPAVLDQSSTKVRLDDTDERDVQPTNFVLSLDGTVRTVSPKISSWLGYAPDHLTGTSLYDHVYREDLLGIFRCIVQLVLGEENEAGLMLRLRTATGTWRACGGGARLQRDGEAILGILLTLYPLLS